MNEAEQNELIDKQSQAIVELRTRISNQEECIAILTHRPKEKANNVSEAEKQQEIKQEMSMRQQPDSLELVYGTPSKGSQVSLKCYGDFSEIVEDISLENPDSISSKKIKGLLKLRECLLKLNIIA